MRATDVPISPEAELAHERRMLERIAGGAPLAGTLEAICRQVECCYPDARCTVLVLDRSLGVLRHGAAPSMPAEFVRQIDGLPAAEGVGACGTAAARAEVVVSAEVAADPGMREFVELAERFELRSVWSQPLVHADGEVIGTFAVYRSRPHTPGREERERVSAAARLATIAIDADTSRRVLREAANLDTLTGLLNRTRFLELVTDALRREPAAPVAAVMVQIDRFAELNRSIGQVAGDRVLVEVAERLRAVCEPHGPLARFAGDTFIAMDAAPPRSGAAERRRSARRLTTLIEQALSEPFHADGVELVLSASIGVATSDLAADALALAREAEIALQAARAGGPGHHQIYDRRMQAAQMQRLRTEAQLRRGIAHGELFLHYQPILDVESRRWCAVEALVRWRHPRRGVLAPDQFIPLAEETGLIVALGEAVLEQALAQSRSWRGRLPDVRLAVNASVLELCRADMAGRVLEAIERACVPPSVLVIEVTETALMAELERVRATIAELRERGVCVMIDDFGTGHSSLARLGELPVDGLKIDRRFALGLGRDRRAAPVVAAIAELARVHGLEVVVEGIEDAAALGAVGELGCEHAQGYHLARPAEAEVIEALLCEQVAA